MWRLSVDKQVLFGFPDYNYVHLKCKGKVYKFLYTHTHNEKTIFTQKLLVNEISQVITKERQVVVRLK